MGIDTEVSGLPRAATVAAPRRRGLAWWNGVRLPWKARPAPLAEPATARPDVPLALMHVPKTAGTSLIENLISACAPAHPVRGFDRVLFGAFDDFASIGEETARAIFPRIEDLPPDGDLITGHFAFSTLTARYPDAQLLTILREPVARLLSHWTFWRATNVAMAGEWGAWAHCLRSAEGSLHDFVQDPRVACQTDNIVTRMLLWPHPLIPDGDFIAPSNDRQVLREALRRLACFSFVGVIENAHLAEALSAWLARPLELPVVNATDRVDPALAANLDEELSNETYAAILSRSRLDRTLWRHAASASLPDTDLDALEAVSRLRAVGRHARLLAPRMDQADSRV